jgi:hypothetical protein
VKKRTSPLKIILLKAKSGVKQPSDEERAATKPVKSVAPVKGRWIQPAPMLEVASSAESLESSQHNLPPKAPKKQLTL